MDFLNHFRPAVSSEHLPCTLFNFDRLWRTTYSKLEGGGGDGPVLVTSSLLTMGSLKRFLEQTFNGRFSNHVELNR